ncbi:unnamed protein product [Protopolystoma xenopodis]|uniref:Uncharacterized protein n=1 Tax=Protopolystoma xenopodis TaxID=117903 RepID=A0A3S5AWN9_9PLAT|nr:unnamed protein product [Protopolystoma xenopodis]
MPDLHTTGPEGGQVRRQVEMRHKPRSGGLNSKSSKCASKCMHGPVSMRGGGGSTGGGEVEIGKVNRPTDELETDRIGHTNFLGKNHRID